MIVDEQRTKVQREPRRELRKRPTWLTVDDGVTMVKVADDATFDAPAESVHVPAPKVAFTGPVCVNVPLK